MEEAELELMDLPIKDLEQENGSITLLTEKNDFTQVQDLLKNMSYHIIE
jgi:transcriptional/translational regulatory protein YebC/TACO1